jgi:N-glycosylase/DNA lyase
MEELPLGIAVSASRWETLLAEHPFDERSLAETLIGGQAFRWYHEPDTGSWLGCWEEHVARLRLARSGELEMQRLTDTSREAVLDYLGVDRLATLTSQLPCNADPVLAGLRDRWGGLSLLRQPPGETVLGFICSSNKQILQIRTMLHRLGARLGQPIPGTSLAALPTWETLAEADESIFKACALGYRARHVAGTAAFLKERPGYLASIEALSTGEAREALLALPGVGPKVADCILLFGYGRTEAFPVDTWIAKLMVAHYPELSGWTRPHLATFARLHYGTAAGLAQQWLFADRNKDVSIRCDQYQIPDDAH